MTHQKTLTVYDDEGGIREFTAADVAELQQDCADLRARVAELERKVADKHEVATVDEICNAYESGVGHRGRPTATVNPYKYGSDVFVAYQLGAMPTDHTEQSLDMVAAPVAAPTAAVPDGWILVRDCGTHGGGSSPEDTAYCAGWNACREAMMSSEPKLREQLATPAPAAAVPDGERLVSELRAIRDMDMPAHDAWVLTNDQRATITWAMDAITTNSAPAQDVARDSYLDTPCLDG